MLAHELWLQVRGLVVQQVIPEVPRVIRDLQTIAPLFMVPRKALAVQGILTRALPVIRVLPGKVPVVILAVGPAVIVETIMQLY
jgi:hypothetical protein